LNKESNGIILVCPLVKHIIAQFDRAYYLASLRHHFSSFFIFAMDPSGDITFLNIRDPYLSG
jgi:hypothetical protein